MLKNLCQMLPLLLLVNVAGAQNLHIYNTANGLDITGASIVIQSMPNGGFQGYETLDLGIKVTNTGGDTLEVGARKVEEDTLQPDVQHTICFANGCYSASTFISPSHVRLAPGASDQGFIAHYLFDNQVHVRGINHISYVLYNVHHPQDSAAVHVTFNTTVAAGVQAVGLNDLLQAYPNPANDCINFHQRAGITIAHACLLITGMNGHTASLQPLSSQPLSFNTAQLPAGVYHYALSAGGVMQASGRLVVVH